MSPKKRGRRSSAGAVARHPPHRPAPADRRRGPHRPVPRPRGVRPAHRPLRRSRVRGRAPAVPAVGRPLVRHHQPPLRRPLPGRLRHPAGLRGGDPLHRVRHGHRHTAGTDRRVHRPQARPGPRPGHGRHVRLPQPAAGHRGRVRPGPMDRRGGAGGGAVDLGHLHPPVLPGGAQPHPLGQGGDVRRRRPGHGRPPPDRPPALRAAQRRAVGAGDLHRQRRRRHPHPRRPRVPGLRGARAGGGVGLRHLPGHQRRGQRLLVDVVVPGGLHPPARDRPDPPGRGHQRRGQPPPAPARPGGRRGGAGCAGGGADGVRRRGAGDGRGRGRAATAAGDAHLAPDTAALPGDELVGTGAVAPVGADGGVAATTPRPAALAVRRPAGDLPHRARPGDGGRRGEPGPGQRRERGAGGRERLRQVQPGPGDPRHPAARRNPVGQGAGGRRRPGHHGAPRAAPGQGRAGGDWPSRSR